MLSWSTSPRQGFTHYSALMIQQSRQASRALLPLLKTSLPTSETVVGGNLAKEKIKTQEEGNRKL